MGRLGGCVLAVAVLFVLRLAIDRDPLTGGLSLAWPEADWLNFRLTAALVALLCGGALGLAGALLQASLRNPLASPSVLGVSSGAGLGVMLALYLAHVGGVAMTSWLWPAACGALVAVSIVLLLGRRDGWPDPVTTILAGVIVATMCGAGMVLLQGLVPDGVRGRFLAWSLGTIPEIVPDGAILILASILALSLVCSVFGHGRLDGLLLDHASAVSIGAHPGATRLASLVVAAVLTAITVSLCGPIGFVGLIAPHLARQMVGAAHLQLVPTSLLAGAGLVLAAEVARSLIDLGTGRLPVGVLTTVVGGTFFLIMLKGAWRRSWHAAM